MQLQFWNFKPVSTWPVSLNQLLFFYFIPVAVSNKLQKAIKNSLVNYEPEGNISGSNDLQLVFQLESKSGRTLTLT